MKMLALLLAASAPQQATQFDLLCKGTETGPDEIEKPFSIDLRVDLKAKLYCADACEERTKIKSVNENYIVLTGIDDPALGVVSSSVDRRTGKYEEYTKVGAATFKTNATCEKARFKGFSRVIQKF